ncbi:Titin [Labeo rohita]|uniref:Titin n=1 Tax=Labeo rohita TaxID=84645 RepID=A0ABQ8L9S9_LABRO|nr:Titin [Labeo rohita]
MITSSWQNTPTFRIDLIDFFSEVSICSDLPVCQEFPPTLPLLSTSMSVWPPLSPDSPAAHPQSTTCAVGSPRVCQLPSASWLEDPSSPPPASESRTPPRPSDPVAPPRLSASSSPSSPVGPPAPPGSLVFTAPPWSVVVPPSPQDSVPPAAPRHAVPPAPKDSSLPPAQPPSSVAPAPPRTSGSPPMPWSPEPRALPRAPPPPSVGPMESSALLPPWLLPPSAPPWVIMAAFWVLLGSSCSGSLLFPPWLLPPSSPPWTLFFALITLFFCPPPGVSSSAEASTHMDSVFLLFFHPSCEEGKCDQSVITTRDHKRELMVQINGVYKGSFLLLFPSLLFYFLFKRALSSCDTVLCGPLQSEVFGVARSTPSVIHSTQRLHQGMRVTLHNQEIFKYDDLLVRESLPKI